MSKQGHRNKAAREMEETAVALGYAVSRTATGHLRFVHKRTGKIVIAPSKYRGPIAVHTYTELKRGAVN